MAYFLALFLLLAVVLTVAAWRRPDRRRRLLRVGAGVVAVAGLGLAAFPPTRIEEYPAIQTAVLLTNGYSPDTLRQLLRQSAPGTPVWRYATATPTPDTQNLSNLPALRQRLPLLRTLHVVGKGLPPSDVATLSGLQVVAHIAPESVGFRSAAWSRQPELGQPWIIEGAFGGNRSPAWVSLRAAGAPRDSVRVPAGGGPFRLRFTPKAEGRALYTLVAHSAKQVLAQESVPLEVRPTRPVRVLLLAAAPSFEIRFLKNYLAAHQHTVAVRTGISRGLTQTEFLNVATPPDLARLTPALLKRFELVVADAGSLAALTSSEAGAMAQAVRGGSIGVLLLADAATLPRSLPGAGSFQLVARPAAATTPQLLSWPDAPARLMAQLPATLRPTATVRPIVLTANQLPAVATRRVGLGQVAVTTLTETFPWVLQGQATAYEAYWSHLLSALVPAISASPSIQLKTAWPRPNTPVVVQVTGAPANKLVLRESSAAPVQIALRQDALVPEWTTAPYWPAISGWHEAQAGAARQWFYVYKNTEWQGPAWQEWIQAAAALTADAKLAPEATTSSITQTAWPRWWGYLVFLLAASLLWLEEKV